MKQKCKSINRSSGINQMSIKHSNGNDKKFNPSRISAIWQRRKCSNLATLLATDVIFVGVDAQIDLHFLRGCGGGNHVEAPLPLLPHPRRASASFRFLPLPSAFHSGKEGGKGGRGGVGGNTQGGGRGIDPSPPPPPPFRSWNLSQGTAWRNMLMSSVCKSTGNSRKIS